MFPFTEGNYRAAEGCPGNKRNIRLSGQSYMIGVKATAYCY